MKKNGLLVIPMVAISFLVNCGSGTKEYTVTFDINDGSTEIESQKVKEGDYANNPRIPVARGIERLRCWSLQDETEDNPEPFSFATTKITSNITLHAIFDEPLSITCTKGPMNLHLYWEGNLENASTLNVDWSKNKKDWTKFNASLQGEYIDPVEIENFNVSLSENETIYLCGDNPNGFGFDVGHSYRSIFISNDFWNDTESEFIVSGNPMSLVNSNDYGSFTDMSNSCFSSLFGFSNITSAKKLILASRKLSESCYTFMFSDCYKLNEAPELPAKILAKECYRDMFINCSSLIKAPELPASSFDKNCNRCYEDMFCGCGNLNHVKVGFGENDVWPDLAFTYYWLQLVSSNGVFEWKGSENPTSFERGRNTVPSGWQIKHVD